jgi:hypothetical protein
MDKEARPVSASEDFLRLMVDKISILAWSCFPDSTKQIEDRVHKENMALRE